MPRQPILARASRLHSQKFVAGHNAVFTTCQQFSHDDATTTIAGSSSASAAWRGQSTRKTDVHTIYRYALPLSRSYEIDACSVQYEMPRNRIRFCSDSLTECTDDRHHLITEDTSPNGAATTIAGSSFALVVNDACTTSWSLGTATQSNTVQVSSFLAVLTVQFVTL